MIKIFTIGGSGLVGSRIRELLAFSYIFDDLSLTTGVDITKPETLEVIKQDREHAIVLHLAAKADVDSCEKDKVRGREGQAYKINVEGLKHVIAAARSSNKKIIYISTDFVFGTGEPPVGGYAETDTPRPLNWYGETKYQAEEMVKNSGLSFLILRIAYPYRKEFAEKKDFVRSLLERLKNNQKTAVVTDHLMNPTFIDDIAYALKILIDTNASGIFHVVGSQTLSPYDVALCVAQAFRCDPLLISQTTREDFFKDRAQRPFNLSMNNDKIQKLGAKMKGFEEGVQELLK